jgi:hypothetical protein
MKANSVLENLANDAYEASQIAIELEQMLAIPVIWTPNLTAEDLDAQLYQSTRSHIAARQLSLGQITWEEYLTYLEELKIDTQSLLDIWDEGKQLF